MSVAAPELVGHGGWIGIEGELSLRALRGRVVVVLFWTFACSKCCRVGDELADLQSRYPDELAVVGVHCPKFPFAAEHAAVVRAAARLGWPFPVLDDPDMVTWQQYGIRGWPSVVVVDARGQLVGALPGSDKVALLHQIVGDEVAQQRRLTQRPGRRPNNPLPLRRARPEPAAVAGLWTFPSKVATDRRGRLAVADTGGDRVVVATFTGPESARVTHTISGLRRPHGVRLYGSELVICDTGHDRVVSVDLARRPGSDETVTPDAAGIIHLRVLPSEVIATDLEAPLDVVADVDGSYVVAESAGQRLWRIPIDGSSAAPIAGDRYEGLVDGPAEEAELAQPSGLTRLPNGLAWVDAESSSMRMLDGRGRVGSLVGEGLFDWGLRDGRRRQARLQHPEGIVAALDGTSLFVADTYNHKLRWWRDRRLLTLPAEGLLEPSGLDVLPDGRLLVADRARHRIALVDPHSGMVRTLVVDRLNLDGPEPDAAWGEKLRGETNSPLTVPFSVMLGDFVLDTDTASGIAVRVEIEAEPPALLATGPRAWTHVATDGSVTVTAGSIPATGLLTVKVTAAGANLGARSVCRSVTRHALTIDH
ncbi:MAG: redoxin domain-containing protein [Acidimicrobiales bacterium]